MNTKWIFKLINAVAIALYESMGFVRTGEIVEGEAVLKMEFVSEEA